LLKAASVWTLFIWIVFIRNTLGDDEQTTGFKVVHLTLAVVSIAFAVAIWIVASRNSRRSERVH
jgi:hypothetical protein